MSKLANIITELRRRRVFRVAAVYAGVAFIIFQIIDATFDYLPIPDWVGTAIIVLLLVGFPIAVGMAWAFDITEKGVVRTPVKKEAAKAESRPHVLIGYLTLALIACLAVAIAIWSWVSGPSKGGPAPPDDRKMLVVLPFENLGTAEDEYFADGITEEITARLAALSGLGVIGRTSAIQYKNTDKPVRRIGEELGVHYILEGTVRWEHVTGGPSRVRVTPQLIKVSDETHLWADIYDEIIAGVFKIQTGIAERVAQALDITLLEPERQALQARPTDNLEAYDYYLRGLYHDARGWAGDDQQEFERAVEMFENAVNLDPDFALAYVALSMAHSWQYFGGFDLTDERLARSRAAVDEALRLRPDLPEALGALAYYYYRGFRDYDRALELFARIQKARPNYSPDLIGWIQRRQGRWEQSAATVEKVFKLNPRWVILAEQQGTTYLYMRRYDEAEAWYNRALSIIPGYPSAQQGKANNCILWTGRLKEARSMAETLPTGVLRDFIFLMLNRLARNYQAALDLLDALAYDTYETQQFYFDRNLGYASFYYLMNEPSLTRVYADSARVRLERTGRDRPGDPRRHAALGLAYALLQRKDDAIRKGRRAVELLPVSKDALAGPQYVFYLAEIYAVVGEYEEAINRLDYLLSIPSDAVSVATLRIDPWWDPLREHPQFKTLLAKYSE